MRKVTFVRGAVWLAFWMAVSGCEPGRPGRFSARPDRQAVAGTQPDRDPAPPDAPQPAPPAEADGKPALAQAIVIDVLAEVELEALLAEEKDVSRRNQLQTQLRTIREARLRLYERAGKGGQP